MTWHRERKEGKSFESVRWKRGEGRAAPRKGGGKREDLIGGERKGGGLRGPGRSDKKKRGGSRSIRLFFSITFSSFGGKASFRP